MPAEDRTLGELDPPQHSMVRRVMLTAMTPRVVHAAEGFIRSTAEELLAAVPVPGRSDLVPAFTSPLPNRATIHLLGFPPADAPALAAWATELIESGFPGTNRSERGEGFALAFPEFAGYIDDKVAERAAELAAGTDVHPDEVLTRLLRLEVSAEKLTRRQVRAMVRNLITGGLTTTSQLLGNLIDSILAGDGVEAELRRDPSLIEVAVEESLRLRPPVMFYAPGACAGHRGGRVPGGGRDAGDRRERVGQPGRAGVRRSRPISPGPGQHRRPSDLRLRPARVPGRGAGPRRRPHPGSPRCSSGSPPAPLRPAPDYHYENVPTFFECGPRALLVETFTTR